MTAKNFKIGQRVECIFMESKPYSLLNKLGTITEVDVDLDEITVKFDRRIMGSKRPWIMYPNQIRRLNGFNQ